MSDALPPEPTEPVRLERLELAPLPELVRRVRAEHANGTLVLQREQVSRRILFHQGNIVFAQSNQPAERLGEFLVERKVMTRAELDEYLGRHAPGEPIGELLVRFGVLSRPVLNLSLRELAIRILGDSMGWKEGTAAFHVGAFGVPSNLFLAAPTPSILFEAVRHAGSTGVLGRCLELAGRHFDWVSGAQQSIPLQLSPQEYFVISRFHGTSIELGAAEQMVPDRLLLYRTVMGLLLAGWLTPHEAPVDEDSSSFQARDETTRSLVEFAERMEAMSYYELLDVPRGAAQTEIKRCWETAKAAYDREDGGAEFKIWRRKILVKLDEAFAILGDPDRRRGYDRMLERSHGDEHDRQSLEQKELQRRIARANFEKARGLAEEADYWGAIQLLESAIEFEPDNADYLWLLGSCQLKNPKWTKASSVTLQKVVALDPSRSEAWIELGRLYLGHRLWKRAEGCFLEALRYDKESEEARLGVKAARARSSHLERISTDG